MRVGSAREGLYIIERMFFRRKKGCLGRMVSAIVGLVVAVAAVFALTNVVVVAAARDRIVDSEDAVSFDAEAIVVLGASVYADGTPSGVLQDRLDDGISLYFAGVAPVIVMSGDNGTETYTETDAMRDYAMGRGVPSSAIICDGEGFSTYESMYRAHFVYGFDRIVVATQTYHLYRAIYVAQGLGMEALGVASDYHDYENQMRFDLREIPARTKDFFQTLLKVPLSSASAVGGVADAIEGNPTGR